MSKIGRKPIFFNGASINIEENIVSYSGKESHGKYIIPKDFVITTTADSLVLCPTIEAINSNKNINMAWGLHRALLNNAIQGSVKLFEKHLHIEGLGFKAELQNNVIIFSLGFSHKIEFNVPKNVSVEIDKTKQNIIFRSSEKDLVGKVGAEVRDLRPVEPYKAKGISYKDEKIIRKAGKTK